MSCWHVTVFIMLGELVPSIPMSENWIPGSRRISEKRISEKRISEKRISEKRSVRRGSVRRESVRRGSVRRGVSDGLRLDLYFEE